MWPIVPMFTCGFVRSNLAFAMIPSGFSKSSVALDVTQQRVLSALILVNACCEIGRSVCSWSLALR